VDSCVCVCKDVLSNWRAPCNSIFSERDTSSCTELGYRIRAFRSNLGGFRARRDELAKKSDNLKEDTHSKEESDAREGSDSGGRPYALTGKRDVSFTYLAREQHVEGKGFRATLQKRVLTRANLFPRVILVSSMIQIYISQCETYVACVVDRLFIIIPPES
jgi:hypothetical protein